MFGGSGVFGARVARGLARAGVRVTLAARDRGRVQEIAASLGPNTAALAADITDPAAVGAAVRGHAVAVNCAGPFAGQGDALLRACHESGCHYVDIGEDRGHAERVRAWGARFAERGLTAAFGCSSLPGVSGALALRARGLRGDPPRAARVALLIGNDNPKGEGAIASMLGTVGRRVPAPQGPLRALGDLERVAFPPPFGRRWALTFDAPEYDLFPRLLGARTVVVKVAFELAVATVAVAALARLARAPGPRMARWIARLGGPLRGIGSSGGVVQTALVWDDGTVRRAAAVAVTDGQAMAAVPAVAVAEALAASRPVPAGAVTAYEALPAEALLRRLQAEGIGIVDDVGPERA